MTRLLTRYKMAQQVVIHVVVKLAKTKEMVNCLEYITRTNESVKYLMPRELQPASGHSELFNLPVVRNAVKCLKKVGQFRNLRVTLGEPIIRKYMDEELNFVFEGNYLEEDSSLDSSAIARACYREVQTESQSGLSEVLGESQKKTRPSEDKLEAVERRFSIEKFNGKQKASDWLESFEAECTRHMITEDVVKVNCLKLFLSDRAIDWYQANIIKVSQNEWTRWVTSFLKVFSEKGWSNVRYAYNFKYLNVSFVEYALKKERMILEVESGMTSTSRLNLIVIGLPIYIQEKLDREGINDTDELINKLGQYDNGQRGQKDVSLLRKSGNRFGEPNLFERKHQTNWGKVSEKKPCNICESLNYPNRFHPLERCRNRDRNLSRVNINLNEASSSVMQNPDPSFENSQKN